jgi:ABC-type amino acid transport substrate-binding protein
MSNRGLHLKRLSYIVWKTSSERLKGFWEPLTLDYLGWGVGTDDKGFLMVVNAALNQWKQDGTLKEILTRWLPYWKAFD